MSRFLPCIASVVLIASLQAGSREDDPIEKEVARITDAYQTATSEAAAGLHSAIVRALERVEKDTALKVDEKIKRGKQLTEELKAFEKNGTIPTKNAALKSDTADYQKRIKSASEKAKAEFEKVANLAIAKKGVAAGEAILARRDKLFAAGPKLPMPADKNSTAKGEFIKRFREESNQSILAEMVALAARMMPSDPKRANVQKLRNELATLEKTTGKTDEEFMIQVATSLRVLDGIITEGERISVGMMLKQYKSVRENLEAFRRGLKLEAK